jgi:multimeric flavodoxin WrbA
MPSTIALFASSRRNGNTGRFMDRVAQELQVEVVDLAARNISPYDYEHRNRGDDFERLMKQILGFDQIIFATPIYWYAASPPMKVFLDRISDFLDLPDLLEAGRRLRGKRAYVLCTSIYGEAAPSFVNAFLETFNYLGIQYGGVAHANCHDGYIPAVHDPIAVAFALQVGGPSRPTP